MVFCLDRYKSLLWVFFHIHRSHFTHNSCLLYTGRDGDIQNRVKRSLSWFFFWIDIGLFCGYFSVYIDHISYTIAACYILGGTETWKIESKGLFHGFFLDRYKSLLWVFFHIHDHISHTKSAYYIRGGTEIFKIESEGLLFWVFFWIDIGLFCGSFSMCTCLIWRTIAACETLGMLGRSLL